MKKFRLNPILRKELKIGARSFKFPIAIALYAAFFSAFALLLFVEYSNSFYAVFGSGTYKIDYADIANSFRILAIAQVVMICIIMPILTAGSIAGERERQTLDIMLTAPVTSFSIAWGKLMAALSNVLIFIVSTIPAMAICFLYGGIEWKYLLVFLIQIMVLAFFIGAIGVWASAIFKRTIVAVIVSLIFEGAFFGLPFIIYGVIYIVKYNIAVAATPNISMLSVKMGWSGLVLLFSPILTTISSILKSTSNNVIVSSILTSFFGSSTSTTAKSFDLIISAWGYVGMVISVLFGLMFLRWTAGIIDGPGKKHGKR